MVQLQVVDAASIPVAARPPQMTEVGHAAEAFRPSGTPEELLAGFRRALKQVHRVVFRDEIRARELFDEVVMPYLYVFSTVEEAIKSSPDTAEEYNDLLFGPYMEVARILA